MSVTLCVCARVHACMHACVLACLCPISVSVFAHLYITAIENICLFIMPTNY